MPTFPDININPLVAGFSVDQMATPVLRTPMNDGTYRQRNKYTTPISMMKVTYRWTGDELAQFRAFHASIGSGAARFVMPVWNGQAFVDKWVQIDQGTVSVSDFLPPPLNYCTASMSLRVESLYS